MDDKRVNRIRRSYSTRIKQKELLVTRVAVFRSNKHLYAQIISPDSKVLASVSSLHKEFRDKVSGNNIASANILGENLAKRAKKLGLKSYLMIDLDLNTTVKLKLLQMLLEIMV